MKPRWLVTGASGTVGSYTGPVLGSRFELDLASRVDLDVTDLTAVRRRVSSGGYAGVIHLAAATDLDRCEKEPSWAYALNVVGAWNVALACREHDAEMVHVSTVGLFCGDGRTGPFSELDEPAPVNVYAHAKWKAEQAVQAVGPRAYVVRTAWVMGQGAEGDRKFVGKVRGRLLAGEPVQAVGDIVGSPTYAPDLVEAIGKLVDTKAHGLYHATNRGAASRFDMVEVMRTSLGSSSATQSVPASTFPLPAPRPVSEVTEHFALRARGIEMRSWQDALHAYMQELKQAK
jgi:dTDP-4-dehydrorhamnose reductase